MSLHAVKLGGLPLQRDYCDSSGSGQFLIDMQYSDASHPYITSTISMRQRIQKPRSLWSFVVQPTGLQRICGMICRSVNPIFSPTKAKLYFLCLELRGVLMTKWTKPADLLLLFLAAYSGFLSFRAANACQTRLTPEYPNMFRTIHGSGTPTQLARELPPGLP